MPVTFIGEFGISYTVALFGLVGAMAISGTLRNLPESISVIRVGAPYPAIAITVAGLAIGFLPPLETDTPGLNSVRICAVEDPDRGKKLLQAKAGRWLENLLWKQGIKWPVI